MIWNNDLIWFAYTLINTIFVPSQVCNALQNIEAFAYAFCHLICYLSSSSVVVEKVDSSLNHPHTGLGRTAVKISKSLWKSLFSIWHTVLCYLNSGHTAYNFETLCSIIKLWNYYLLRFYSGVLKLKYLRNHNTAWCKRERDDYCYVLGVFKKHFTQNPLFLYNKYICMYSFKHPLHC